MSKGITDKQITDIVFKYKNSEKKAFESGDLQEKLHINVRLALLIERFGYAETKEYAAVYADIGMLLLELKNYDGSIKAYRTAVETSLKLDGVNIDAANYSRDMARPFIEKELYNEALNCLARSWEVYRDILGEDDPESIRTLDQAISLGSIMREKGIEITRIAP